MAVITAKGKTKLGDLSVRISGEKKVEKIDCDPSASWYFEQAINRADGWLANGYHPEAGTMLQAYALLVCMFGYNAVTVDGDLDEIPHEEGVIY